MMLRAGRRDSRLPPKESGTVRASIYGHLLVTSIRYKVGSNFSKIWSQQTSKHLLAFTICGFICVSKSSRWITVVQVNLIQRRAAQARLQAAKCAPRQGRLLAPARVFFQRHFTSDLHLLQLPLSPVPQPSSTGILSRHPYFRR